MLRLFDRLNLTPSERRLVVVIGAVALVVLNYWLVWPRFNDFRNLSEEIESMEEKRALFEREIARRPTYEATLRKLQAEGSVLPAGEERIQFRSDMERMARSVGLHAPTWSEVLPERGQGATTNAFFEAFSLTMSRVSGTEQQFVDFLYNVGASNSTIRVKELTLAPGNVDPRQQARTNLVATIKLVASVQKAAPLATAPTPTAATPSAPPPAPSVGATPPGATPTNPVPVAVRATTRTNIAGRTSSPGS